MSNGSAPELRLEAADKHAEIVHRIYTDHRAGPEPRELLLAVAYACVIAPRENGRGPLQIAARLLGRDAVGRPRFNALISADAPRYEPPRDAGDWNPGGAPGCQAPRLRPYVYRPRKQVGPESEEDAPVPIHRDRPPIVHVAPGHVPPEDFRNKRGICGADSHHRVVEKDLRTGWVIPHWFCRRHTDHAERVAAQVREQNEQAPEPIPNRGGLLPCYFKAPWETVYRHYTPGWTPPTYGLAADDWPTPESAQMPSRTRLRLVVD